jgi:hypothetical protein
MGFGFKVLFSIGFILLFQYYYGSGNLYGDAYNFVHDGQLLNQLAQSDFGAFLEVFLGINDESHLENVPYLNQTQIWTYGDNGDLLNDNRLMIRLQAVIHFFSFGNVFVHGLVMAFLSFLGIVFTFKSFEANYKRKKLAFYLLICFPSVAFWGSGITKEALMFLGIGLFFWGGLKCVKSFQFKYFIALITGLSILLLNKPHVGLFLIAFSPLFVLAILHPLRKTYRLIVLCSIPCLFYAFTWTPSSINLLEKVSYKQKDMINMGKGGIFFVTDSSFCTFDYEKKNQFEIDTHLQKIRVNQPTQGEYKLFGKPLFRPFTIPASQTQYDIYLIQPPSASYIETNPINYERANLLKSIPDAITNTVFRPYPTDPGSPLKYLALMSNFILIVFLMLCIFYRRTLDDRELTMRLFLFISALSILLLIGWSIPILGAIVRYKVAAELLLLIAGLMTIQAKKSEQHEN